MKKLLFLLLMVFCCNLNVTKAQTIDNFNYSGYLSENGWSIHNGTTYPISTTTGLSYSGYIGSGIGNAALIGNAGGQDVNYTPGIGPYETNGAAVYLAFMFKATETGTKSGDYFLHLGKRTSETNFTNHTPKIFARTSSNTLSFGISNTTTVTYGDYNFTVGTTYLIVVKYTINTSGNDEADMWVFPSGIPASETAAGAATASNTTTEGQDIINGIALRQGSTAYSASVAVDGIRIAASWADVLFIPEIYSATNSTSTGFTANWGAVSDAAGYYLDIAADSTFTNFLDGYNNKDVGNVTSYSVSETITGHTYYYRIRAYNSDGTGSYSGIMQAGALAAAPNALAATDIAETGFTANWETSDGAESYWIDISTVSDFSSFISGYENKEIGNVNSCAVTSLYSATVYYYRVRASNTFGTSASSNIVSVETSAVTAPTAHEPTNVSTNSFTALWNYSKTASGFYLDVSTDPDFTSFLDGYQSKDVGNVYKHTITSLTPCTKYYYRVRATNAGGTSNYSNVITVNTLLEAPVATEASGISSSAFTANWNASSGASNYWLDVSTAADFSSLLASYDNKQAGNVTSYIVTGLSAGTTYYYRICSSNDTGSSPYSNVITVSTGITGISDEKSALPATYELYQNYPNPFNPSTIIKYQLPESAYVTIKIYDILGSEICALVNEEKSAGVHQVKFSSRNMTSGMYICRILAGNYTQTIKMILMK